VSRARRPAGGRATPGTVVVLVRHGNTPTTGKLLPGRAAGLHLSELGRAQAEGVAARIAELPRAPSAVYASPLERTRETAAPIARALGLRVRSARGLIECDVGAWTGESLARVSKLPEWADVQRWPSGFRFPGGESFSEMWSRVNDAIVGLVGDHRGETVVVVSHADPIRAVVAGATGVPLDLFQRVVVSPCSVSTLWFGPGGPHVLCVNSTGSLKDLALS
jgi:probable phosphoglycerate mutase